MGVIKVPFYYAGSLEGVIGRDFSPIAGGTEEAGDVSLDMSKMSRDELEAAEQYIHRHGPSIAVGWCDGKEDFVKRVEERGATWAGQAVGPDRYIPEIVKTLPELPTKRMRKKLFGIFGRST